MPSQSKITQEKILRSATVIFGQLGYKDATIRKISEDAQVNIAAINYHFQGKEGLYGAVLEELFRAGFSRFPATPELSSNAEPEERLRAFIKAMFYRLQSRKAWGGMSSQGRLIARELLDPSPAFAPIVEKYIKPHKDLLLSIIREIMQINPGQEKLMSCAISIIGQCIFYSLASTLIRKLNEESAPTESNLDQLADSVWLFSLGGIARIKEEFLSKAKAES